jgi:hypothetical protein
MTSESLWVRPEHSGETLSPSFEGAFQMDLPLWPFLVVRACVTMAELGTREQLLFGKWSYDDVEVCCCRRYNFCILILQRCFR